MVDEAMIVVLWLLIFYLNFLFEFLSIIPLPGDCIDMFILYSAREITSCVWTISMISIFFPSVPQFCAVFCLHQIFQILPPCMF